MGQKIPASAVALALTAAGYAAYRALKMFFCKPIQRYYALEGVPFGWANFGIYASMREIVGPIIKQSTADIDEVVGVPPNTRLRGKRSLVGSIVMVDEGSYTPITLVAAYQYLGAKAVIIVSRNLIDETPMESDGVTDIRIPSVRVGKLVARSILEHQSISLMPVRIIHHKMRLAAIFMLLCALLYDILPDNWPQECRDYYYQSYIDQLMHRLRYISTTIFHVERYINAYSGSKYSSM